MICLELSEVQVTKNKDGYEREESYNLMRFTVKDLEHSSSSALIEALSVAIKAHQPPQPPLIGNIIPCDRSEITNNRMQPCGE